MKVRRQVFAQIKNPRNPFLNDLIMVENLINSGFYIKFGYMSLAEQISDKSNRLIDVANAYINEHTIGIKKAIL